MVGGTPLVRLDAVTSHLADDVDVYAKLEFMNPGGSVKDRPARRIILDAIEAGNLGDGQTLIDSTSGNTGVAYAMLGAAVGIDVTLVMPENVSQARKHIVQTFGAEVVYSDPMEGSDGAIRKVREMVEADDGDEYFFADQYGNPSNPKAHEETTAPEISSQTDGRVTHFVTATGTSGTIMGTARGLRDENSDVEIVGIQPDDPFHGLEGLKHMPSAIEPDIYEEESLDEVRFVSTEVGWDMAQRLAVEEGIACGYSSGANVHSAIEVAEELDEGVVVTIVCDHADRYLGE
ncbi:MAG: PLP-dependent cysteine synthase family protein [Bradymonadaceae bacterium]